jgi:ferritin heavy chain
MDFIEGNFLNQQIESIKILSTYINTLKRVGEGLGEYEFDKTTLGGK